MSCRVGREVTRPDPSPEPYWEITTIRLLRRCGSWLPTPYLDCDSRSGERPPSQHIRESLPRQTLSLTSTAKPFVPGPLRRFDEQLKTMIVAADAKVVEVTFSASLERGVLILDREMPIATAPLVDGRLRPSQTRPPSLAPHLPVTSPSPPPIEGEPQKVKGRRTFTALLRLWRAPKRQQPCLVRVQGQSKAPQAFLKH